jgi:hypothetical protein
MSHEILPLSHCKFCKELAEDCECKRKGWRPDGWKLAGVEAAKPINLVPDDVRRMLSKDAYEQGASAMLSAVIKWLDADCPHCFYLFHGERKSKCKRKDCPQCMAELRGEK